MKIGYVVLYVTDPESCLDFWTNKVGMAVKETTEIPGNNIYRVGFTNQDFSFELVPLGLMIENPDGLNLGTPSICFYVDDIHSVHEKLNLNSVSTTVISERKGKGNFAFSDNENRWFAVLES